MAVNNAGGSFLKLSRDTVCSFSFYYEFHYFIGFILHWVDQIYWQSLVLVFYHFIQRVIRWIFLHDSFLLEYISVIFISLGENCLYSEFFWSLFSCIWTDYGEIVHIFLHSVQMRTRKVSNTEVFQAISTSEAHLALCPISVVKPLAKTVTFKAFNG